MGCGATRGTPRALARRPLDTAVTTLTLALGPGGLGPEVRLPARIASPQTLGAAAGEYFPTGDHAEMAADQAADDALSLCFDGPPVKKPMVLVGRANLRLTLTSDQPTGFVVARLCDVAPDGTSSRIAHGMLNLCHRAGSADPQLVEPGQPVQVILTLDAMAHRLAPGHRLRLALSNSYWPFLWPSAHSTVLVVTAGRWDCRSCLNRHPTGSRQIRNPYRSPASARFARGRGHARRWLSPPRVARP
ncbi:MAG: hypothetical protein HC783_18085 [Rhodobacteraceae bacterium]|nr:hypothetical protein [Paracoccaceae bacterium]